MFSIRPILSPAVLVLFAGCAGFFGEKKAAIPSPSVDWIARGDSAYEAGTYAEAVLRYREAAKSGQQPAVAYFNMAHCLVRLDRQKEALAAYRQSVREAPGFLRAHQNLAALYQLNGEPVLAAKHYQRVIEIDPSDKNAYYRLGEMARDLGDCAEASRWFEKTIVLAPNDEASWSAMVQCHLQALDTVAAAVALERYGETGEAGSWALLLLGDLRAQAGDAQGALSSWEKAASRDSTDKRPWLRMARLQRSLGHSAEAAITLETLLKTHANQAELWTSLAGLRFEAGDPIGAQEAYVKAYRLGDAEGLRGLERLAAWYERRGEAQAAASVRSVLAAR